MKFEAFVSPELWERRDKFAQYKALELNARCKLTVDTGVEVMQVDSRYRGRSPPCEPSASEQGGNNFQCFQAFYYLKRKHPGLDFLK